jgi:hypothetical protein
MTLNSSTNPRTRPGADTGHGSGRRCAQSPDLPIRRRTATGATSTGITSTGITSTGITSTGITSTGTTSIGAAW